MEEEKRKAYSEVVEILKLIDDEKRIEKIPFEVIELIKKNSDPEYKPSIDKEKPLEDQGLRTETYSIIGWIASKYWNEEILEHNDEENISESNTQNEEPKTVKETINNIEERAAAYNDIEPIILENCINKDNLPVLKSKIKWFVRIKEQVIKLLKVLFGKKNIREQDN